MSVIHRGWNKTLRIWNKEKNRDSVFIRLFHRGRNLFFLKARFRNGMFSYKIQSKDLPHGVIGLTVFDKHYGPVAERHFFNELNEEDLNIKIEMDRDWSFIRDSVQVSVSTQHHCLLLFIAI